MTLRPYSLTGPIGSRAMLGLIVLQVDETVEQDFRRLFPSPEIGLYVTRIPSGAHLTADTIAAMEVDLPRAARLLPPSVSFDAVGYACTSGTTLIGPERVAELIRGAAATRHVADPLTAALEAFTALGIRRIAIVSPYIEEVSQPIVAAFERHGLSVTARAAFGEEVEARVARIDPASIRAAALEIGHRADVEAVFLSCTNLRTLDIIDDLEAALGKPVVSSNQALAWHLGRLSSTLATVKGPGRLMKAAPG